MLWVEDVKILYVVEHDLISQPFSPVIGGAGLFRSCKKQFWRQQDAQSP